MNYSILLHSCGICEIRSKFEHFIANIYRKFVNNTRLFVETKILLFSPALISRYLSGVMRYKIKINADDITRFGYSQPSSFVTRLVLYTELEMI